MFTRAQLTREKVGRVVEMLTSKRVRVTQVGMKAYVKWNKKGAPEIVNLPYIPDTADDGFLDAIEGFLDHEVAHILFTEFKWVEKSYLLGKQVVQLTNLIEDTWIERRMSKEFAGTGSNLGSVRKFFLQHISNPLLAKALLSGDTKEVQSVVLVPAFRALANQPEFKEWMDDGDKWKYVADFFAVVGADLMEQVPKVKSTEGSFLLAVAIHNRIQEAKKKEQERREKAKKEREERKKAKEKERAPKEPKPSEEGDPGDEDGDPSDDKSDEGDDGAEPEEGPDAHADTDPEPEKVESDDADDADDDEDESDGDDDDDEDESEDESDGDDDADDEDESEDESEEGSEDESEEASEEETASEEDPEEGDPTDTDADGETEEGAEAPTAISDEGSDTELTEHEESMPDEPDVDVPEVDVKDFDEEVARALSEVSAASVDESTYLALTKDNDKIERYEPSLPEESIDTYARMLDESVGGMVGTIQKQLERAIAARSHARHVPGFRTGKLHSASLHRLSVGDDRVFQRKQVVTTKDVAVSLVIDMSGSMSGRKLTIAVATAYALSSALDKLNIKHEVCGFTTKPGHLTPEQERATDGDLRMFARWEAIYQPIIKGFDERLSSERQRAFAAVEHEVHKRENIDGESIEYASIRLARRPEKRKILIVLSDGQPACATYHRDGYTLLNEHLRAVVKRMLGYGIEPYGIGILTSAVAEFYPNYTVIERLEDLPSTVMSAVENMLLGRSQVAA